MNSVFRIVAMFVIIDLESVLHVVCKCTVFACCLFTELHLPTPSVLFFITMIWPLVENFFTAVVMLLQLYQNDDY